MAFDLTAILNLQNNMSDSLRNAIRDLNRTSSETTNLTSNTSKLGDTAKKVGGLLAGAFAIDKIKDLGVSMIESAGEARAMEAQFSTVFGDMEGEASKKLSAIGDEASILDNRMKGSFTKIAAFAKTGGMDTADSLDLADRSMRAVADSAAFYDKSLESTTDSLQSFLKGNFENDAALGLSSTETTRNAAANELYGKSFKELSEAQKQLTSLQMVEDANKLTGAMGQASREADGWENIIGNLKQSWTDFKSAAGEPLLDAASESIQQLSGWLSKLDTQPLVDGLQAMSDKFLAFKDAALPVLIVVINKAKEIATTIKNNWEPIKAVIAGVAGAFVAFKVIVMSMMVMSKLNAMLRLYRVGMLGAATATAIMNAVAALNPFVLIALAIGVLVGVLVYLVRNTDWAREAFDKAWAALKTGATIVMEWLQPYITTAMAGIKAAFATVSAYISEVMPLILAVIQNVWSIIGPIFTTALTAIWEAVKFAFNTIKDVISVTLNLAIGIIKTVWGVISGIFKAAMQLLTGDFSGAWDTMKETLGKAITNIGDTLTKWVDGAKKLGENFVQGIIDGFLAIWDSLLSTASDIWDSVTGIFDKKKTIDVDVNRNVRTGGVGGSAQVDGSHYNGLDRVPYNGYTARLHKGERVMTAAENKAYSGGGSNVVNLTVHYNGGQKLDEQEMSRFTNYLVKNLASAGAGGA
ncbi:hypothetical protein [uncultured Planococcus sp.]|uniref:phage tail protein n=1 Tax=uncultured Planococcus sp. TaxID=337815 RepID=UPI002618F327|nr:hypothetical protein [uncultured Planococcus sp.]